MGCYYRCSVVCGATSRYIIIGILLLLDNHLLMRALSVPSRRRAHSRFIIEILFSLDNPFFDTLRQKEGRVAVFPSKYYSCWQCIFIRILLSSGDMFSPEHNSHRQYTPIGRTVFTRTLFPSDEPFLTKNSGILIGTLF